MFIGGKDFQRIISYQENTHEKSSLSQTLHCHPCHRDAGTGQGKLLKCNTERQLRSSCHGDDRRCRDFAAVGRFTFDGKGNLTGKLFVRVNGNNMAPPVFTGTYSVSPDCTVTDNWGAPINSTHVSVIVDDGKGYFILNNTLGSGDTISAEAR